MLVKNTLGSSSTPKALVLIKKAKIVITRKEKKIKKGYTMNAFSSSKNFNSINIKKKIKF